MSHFDTFCHKLASRLRNGPKHVNDLLGFAKIQNQGIDIMNMTNFLAKTAMVSAVSLAFATASSAQAASFIFSVDYDGTTATLAAGSDDPLTTTLVAGDTFTYSLNATGGQGWTTIAAGSLFPFFALTIDESGSRSIDYDLNLNRLGASVFSDSAAGITNEFVHLGTNSVNIVSGLEYDQYVLDVTILAGSDAATADSLLPWSGAAPEDNFPNAITFGQLGAPVPEPATWAFMIFGFGAIGGAMRRQRKANVKVSYA